MPESRLISRRNSLKQLAAAGLAASMAGCRTWEPGPLRISRFEADVTVPVGHGMMGGAWVSKTVADPLEARGIVITGAGLPVVFVSVDWCEIRNDAFARWQEVLAAAAGTSPERVMLSTIHQHDTPVADLTAERILRERGLRGSVCDPDFHERAVQRVASAVRHSLDHRKTVTHIGTGQGRVRQVASNRRYRMPDGQVRFDRTSSTRNAFAIEGEEGLIDPWLKTLSFWNGDNPVAALSFYAVHPMSYYGQGEVSADFPGIARRARQKALPAVHQIYVSGCSGNITAGKYNNGARENRPVLAARISEAMADAWIVTRKHPVRKAEFRSAPLNLDPRWSAGFLKAELESRLIPSVAPFQQCLAAMGLSWLKRVESGSPIEVPCLDLGVASLLVLPGEAYLEFQLAAQAMRPDQFVCTAGYGDGATGYIPTEQHWREGDTNLGDWCWVAQGSEQRVLETLSRVLQAG